MIDLLTSVYRLYPHLEPIYFFKANLPLYRITFTAQVLERRRLQLIPQFILRAIELDVNSVETLADLLGLEESVVLDAAGELLQADLVEEAPILSEGQSTLQLTITGRSFLDDMGPMPVTRRASVLFDFNPVTNTLDRCYKMARKELDQTTKRLFALPQRTYSPSLQSLTVNMIQEPHLSDERSDAEVIELLEVQQSYPVFLTGVDVVILGASAGPLDVVLVFHDGGYLPEVSHALSEMMTQGSHVLPEDAHLFGSARIDSKPLETCLNKLGVLSALSLSQRISFCKRGLAVRTAASRLSDFVAGGQFNLGVADLNRNLARANVELQEILRKIWAETDQSAKVLEGENNGDAIAHILEEARHKVLILTPRIGLSFFTEEHCRALGNAARRLDRLFIGTSFRRKTSNHDEARVASLAKEIWDTIEGLSRWDVRSAISPANLPSSLELRHVPYNGPSIFIGDEQYALITELPLHYPSLRDQDREPSAPGILLQSPEAIRVLQNAMNEVIQSTAGEA
jgi:hypothetical protein